MNPVVEAFLASWPFDPVLLLNISIAAAVYLRGFCWLRRRDPRRWTLAKPTAFVGGLTALFVALASPVEPFSFLLLQWHMVQHLLLTMVVPPLIWLGAPLMPLLRGIPASMRTYWVAPLFRSRTLRSFFGWLTHPVVALPVYVVVTWAWHLPALYERALASDDRHYVQHAMFLVAALLFWFPVIRPYPARPRWSKWLLFPYLILADVQNTALAALLTFSDRVLYPHYEAMPRIGGVTALDDQAAAGAIMWVPGSLVYLVPLAVLAVGALFGNDGKPAPKRIPLSVLTDVPRTSRLQRFLRWRHARLVMQIPLLLIAIAVAVDGFLGPAASPMNLAGVLPWIHWRGLLILGMMILGNVFCMACPFMLPRNLARRFVSPRFTWPRVLRHKWLAVVALGLFLWAYEAFALWDSPWLTAWIIVGYFVSALVIDSLFRGATFCKYVCPIGQFNFVQSMMAPTTVQVKSPTVCKTCETKDCIRGNESARGCELGLFVPRKIDNLDCTLCLDCIRACPYDNISIALRIPGSDLADKRRRSGIGRLSRRNDLAVLVVLLTFGAFANAAGMVAPVLAWQDEAGLSRWQITALSYLVALLVLPVLLIGSAALLTAPLKHVADTARRFSYCLVPLGFAMWLSHYSFHLFTSYEAAWPTLQRALFDLGINLGEPDWACACCRPLSPWILHFEMVALGVGLLLSLYTAYLLADGSLQRVLPWAVLLTGLYALGIWIVLQPMQMRGTMNLVG